MTRILIAAALAALCGCGAEDGAGGLTADESRQLNEAADMLDTAPEAAEPGGGNAQ